MKVEWEQIGKIFTRSRVPIEIDGARSYRFVGVRSFGKGLIRYDNTPADQLSKMSYFQLEPHALVVSNIKAWEGAVAISSPGDESFIVSNRFHTYLPTAKVDLRYALHYLTSAPGVAAMSAASPGSADRNRTLGVAAFENLTIPLPDLPEQQRIAGRIDAIALLTREVSDHPRGQNAIVRHRTLSDLRHRSTPTPAGKLLRRRLDAVDVLGDQTYPMLGMQNQGRGPFDAGELLGSATSYSRLFRAHAGDLVYLKLGAWERAFGIVPPELDGRFASGEFVMYELRDSLVDRDFLSQLIRWEQLIDGIGGKSTGTNVRRRRLKPETFEAASLPLPPLPEQRRVGALLGRLDEVERLQNHRAMLATALLPAARNEEFSRLLANAPAR